MKLDRNLSDNGGRGKYALLKLRQLTLYQSNKTFERFSPEIERAISLLEHEGILDWGETSTENEFFVIRLKDKYAPPALYAYAEAAMTDDAEYASEIVDMAKRAGPLSPWCKVPD
jgi:hypothetical protein